MVCCVPKSRCALARTEGDVVTLAQTKADFRRKHPNLRTNGWDTRDYELWSQLHGLKSYSLVAGSDRNPMIALADVVSLLRMNAEKRFKTERKARFGVSPAPKETL